MKPVVAVFAHPDDEAFGPGGTLAKLCQKRDVYIVCVTDGDAGMNSTHKTEALGDIRKAEMLQSTKVLGIKKIFFLGYKDGTLCNNFYHEIADKIQKIIDPIKPEILLTFEPRGVSGHIDHMAVSMITTYVYERSGYVAALWYYCLPKSTPTLFKNYFIYFPPGYTASEIDKVVDVAPVWDQKLKAMFKHESQAHDIKRILAVSQRRVKEEYFMILRRDRFVGSNKGRE